MARRLWIAVAACAAITVVGLVVLWPRGDAPATVDAGSLFGTRVSAVVIGNDTAPCTDDPLAGCHHVTVQIASGAHRGEETTWEVPYGPTQRTYDVGDDIYVYATTLANGTVSYEFADFRRDVPVLLLALIFVAAVIALARWKGVGAIGGLVASLLVLVGFVLPSLLRGHDAVLVALVGSSVIAFVALYLAHGINVSTTVALLATFTSLALIGVLAWVFVTASSLSGYTDDSSFVLTALGIQIDARGLLLAGIVIGSLGVLDDVTVTQVSAVSELRQAKPGASRRDIYRSAVNIGRDHISSTVNTLFLTYAGAALPLLLLFSVAGQPMSTVATGEVVATEVVRSLVGSIGLVAAVPIATWLAAAVLTPAAETSAAETSAAETSADGVGDLGDVGHA